MSHPPPQRPVALMEVWTPEKATVHAMLEMALRARATDYGAMMESLPTTGSSLRLREPTVTQLLPYPHHIDGVNRRRPNQGGTQGKLPVAPRPRERIKLHNRANGGYALGVCMVTYLQTIYLNNNKLSKKIPSSGQTWEKQAKYKKTRCIHIDMRACI